MEVRQSLNPVYSEAFARAVLDAYTAAPVAALAATPKVRLWVGAEFDPTPQTLLAAFAAAGVEAAFTDYAEKNLILVEPVNLVADVDGAVGTVTFQMTTDPTVTGQLVLGYFVTVGAAPIVCCYEKFAVGQEVVMAAPGDTLVLTIALPVMQRQRAG